MPPMDTPLMEWQCDATRDRNREAQGGTFRNILVNDGSILVCVTGDDLRREHRSEGGYGVSSAPSLPHVISQEPMPPTINTQTPPTNISTKTPPTTVSTQTPPTTISTQTPPTTVSTQTPPTNISTQTPKPEVLDKNVNTVVYNSDLDHIAEEFLRLRRLVLRSDSVCAVSEQRAQQAELRLLTLQFVMCKRHCSGSFCSSEEELRPQNEAPPPDVMKVLQRLESDWENMKEQVLAGVPLEGLQPLCVDSFIPAQIITDTLNNASLRSSQNPSGEADGSTNEEKNQEEQGSHAEPTHQDQYQDQDKDKHQDQDKDKHQDQHQDQHQHQDQGVHQHQDKHQDQDQHQDQDVHQHQDQNGKTTVCEAVCEDLSVSEAWFDAEEYLQPPQHTRSRDGGSSDLHHH